MSLLHGGCQCGRNIYIVQFPKQETPSSSTGSQAARLLFNQRHPLTPLLRVPLSSYRSLTLPVLPDESHSLIHRSYTPPNAPNTLHTFCGYCGTPLSYHTSSPEGEGEYIQVTVNSLWESDLGKIDNLTGTSPGDSDAEEEGKGQTGIDGLEVKRGSDWFEGLVEGSRLGRLRRREMRRVVREERGARGVRRVEYEISEWVDGEELEGETEGEGGRKRKFELAEGGGGREMGS
ncbi:hypothetical protein QC762_710525 [Podospora pseudocomata]|uniref:CENP-V/GFA domain-containing protein n=1 Tax=Podospora pseudocomata TaxID=2093779 RepID=A0ABR0G4V9_9PEZI|nr:hypothetical protein QC762_710525 [Podospora pseudocomata]